MLYFFTKTVILFYNNDFIIYLVILSNFDNLKLDKTLSSEHALNSLVYLVYSCNSLLCQLNTILERLMEQIGISNNTK